MKVDARMLLPKGTGCCVHCVPEPCYTCSYPTELREETYYPWYFSVPRPSITDVSYGPHAYGTTFDVTVATTSVGGGDYHLHVPSLCR